MRQVKKKIEAEHGDRFIIGTMSVQGIVIKDNLPEEIFLEKIPHLFWNGIIEVKSYKSLSKIKEAKKQAANYAKQTGLDSVTIALFVPVEDEKILAKLSGKDIIEKIKVNVCAIGWV